MVMNGDKNEVRQRKWVYATISLAAILFFTNVLEADFATPFVEVNNKVGDISEAHGYVVALSPNIEQCTHFLVIVTTDCEEHVVINATANRELITQSFLGKPVIIKAKVISRNENARTKKTEIELEILSVRPLEKQTRHDNKSKIIIPGVRVGDYKLGMSKDDVLKILGKTKADSLRQVGNSIRVDGLGISIIDDSVKEITVFSTRYKFANGLGVGDSKQEFVEAFGRQFQFTEDQGKLYLTYKAKGLEFIIHKKNRTVMEISVTKKISRLPEPIKSVKPYDDVRWKDLSKLDLSTRKKLIATLTFNQKTVWPEQAKMPPGSDPNKILTDALNPGLGVRELHQQGITGEGVNVAIIDQPMYLVHPEFAGKIVAYHDTGCQTDESSMHGPLVASLLVGTNCGTAPDARVYYAAVPSWKMDAAYYAKGLDWIIAQNEKLPEEEKIRVVSVSASPNQSSWANRQMWDRACARAEADGIMVLDCTNSRRRGFIGRCWYNARVPESVAQCNPWAPPNREFRGNPTDMGILVPSSPRTAAEDGDVPGYQYAGRGGLSRAIPYCAGVLAMGWEVNPELSPEQMRKLLFKSAFTKKNGAKIIYPKKFIHLVRRAKAAPLGRDGARR